MGSNSALITAKVIDNTYQVLSLYIQAISHAMDLVNEEDSFSEKGKSIHNTIKELNGSFDSDLPINEKGATLIDYLKNNQPIEI